MVNWSVYSEVTPKRSGSTTLEPPQPREDIAQLRPRKRTRGLWQISTLVSRQFSSAFWTWAMKGGADTLTYLVLLFASGVVALQVLLWFLIR